MGDDATLFLLTLDPFLMESDPKLTTIDILLRHVFFTSFTTQPNLSFVSCHYRSGVVATIKAGVAMPRITIFFSST